MSKAKNALGFLKETFREFGDDDCPRMAAALAYYTVFSLPPLLVILIGIAGLAWGEQAVAGRIEGEVGALLGPQAGEAIATMVENAGSDRSGSRLAAWLGLAVLLFGASGVFAQLQAALNEAWDVAPDPDKSGVVRMVTKRLLSFGMVLGIGFLLLVSLALSAFLSAAGEMVASMLPAGISQVLLQGVHTAVALAIIMLLFAAIYKVMPDAEVSWRDTWVGAGVTALLFVVGKFAIGFYLGNSDPGSAYGAAGSLVLILVWIYYASLIVLLGAEFTQVWARRYGRGIVPEKGAVRVVEQKRHLHGAAARRHAESERSPRP
ncbi:MAG TPA: YihY/virulence factor BrkB family protein [Thermoanaerobaculia bacterium]|nr:YihY/virulence factor BrkB family protein [Thermoanaerobaculia bacterium]